MTICELLQRFTEAWPPCEGAIVGESYDRLVEREFYARERDKAVDELHQTVSVMAANPTLDFTREAERVAADLDERARRVALAVLEVR